MPCPAEAGNRGKKKRNLSILRSGYHFCDPPRFAAERTVSATQWGVVMKWSFEICSPHQSTFPRNKKTRPDTGMKNCIEQVLRN